MAPAPPTIPGDDEPAHDEIRSALSHPSAYPHSPASVEHVQTHISDVFIAPPFAYKLKKPVRLDFLDFATAERRRRFCEEEVRLNRRLCPEIYLGVLPVVRTEAGAIRVGGQGRVLDHVVWMRALPTEGLLPAALRAGRVHRPHVTALAARLAAFHAAAECPADLRHAAEAEPVGRTFAAVLDGIARLDGRLLPPSDLARLSDFGASFLRRHLTLLRARSLAGRVREGHGDLHGRNLFLLERALPALADAPAVPPGLHAFDCIEFSRELRTSDVASEVAFLAMDLEWRGRSDLGRAFVEAYVEVSGDRDLPLLLPFYCVARACVRGLVDAITSREPEVAEPERRRTEERSRSRLRLARELAWRARGPVLVAMRGWSGSGKTTLARRLAERTGFELVSSDEVRKERAGLDPGRRVPPEREAELYAEEARLAVYRELASRAAAALAAGRSVVVDATHNRHVEREITAEAARRGGVPLLFLECAAPEAEVRERLAARARRGRAAAGEPALSDADWSVYLRQRAAAEPLGSGEPRLTVDASGPDPEAAAERALAALWSWRRSA